MAEKTTPVAKVGMNVIYVGTKGHEKPANVAAVPSSINGEDPSIPKLDEGEIHLNVFPIGAAHYQTRFNVPFGKAGLPSKNTSDFYKKQIAEQYPEANEDEIQNFLDQAIPLVGYWKFID